MAETKQHRTVCPKCGASVRLRKDGKIAAHRVPRAYRYQKASLGQCSAGEVNRRGEQLAASQLREKAYWDSLQRIDAQRGLIYDITRDRDIMTCCEMIAEELNKVSRVLPTGEKPDTSRLDAYVAEQTKELRETLGNYIHEYS